MSSFRGQKCLPSKHLLSIHHVLCICRHCRAKVNFVKQSFKNKDLGAILFQIQQHHDSLPVPQFPVCLIVVSAVVLLCSELSWGEMGLATLRMSRFGDQKALGATEATQREHTKQNSSSILLQQSWKAVFIFISQGSMGGAFVVSDSRVESQGHGEGVRETHSVESNFREELGQMYQQQILPMCFLSKVTYFHLRGLMTTQK